jgi:transposase
MNRLIERCAMLDVHKAQVTACVRVPDGDGGRRQEVREFRTTTAGLITLADWLRSYAVTVVGMESTGVYWRAIYYLLEDEFECQLFNARHLRHVPGRKSDVQDAEWGCQLIEHGLIRTSFVPPRPQRELRDLVRCRLPRARRRVLLPPRHREHRALPPTPHPPARTPGPSSHPRRCPTTRLTNSPQQRFDSV